MSLTLKQACRMVAKTRRRIYRLARRVMRRDDVSMEPDQLVRLIRHFAETAADHHEARALAAEWERRKTARDRLVVALAEQKWALLRRVVFPRPIHGRTVFAVPPEVARCGYCAGLLVLDVNEWEAETGRPTQAGCYVECEHDTDDGPDHSYMPYVYHLPVQLRVADWARKHVRITGV